jgi:hypothetical protein
MMELIKKFPTSAFVAGRLRFAVSCIAATDRSLFGKLLDRLKGWGAEAPCWPCIGAIRRRRLWLLHQERGGLGGIFFRTTGG